ncbi:OLC1v1004820C1 [Oldenlandia corymbosa var. corymbosa]|uniref:OLC1v1004820C1 n=1 Tax=Oldenlandia corymbosa var. corymbosa TaxID=529605 RepID=A0AAV1DD83_OLDCO|nr:OLC1v1004820C1 [Oldenlandia corymbosa var. corymbosa]
MGFVMEFAIHFWNEVGVELPSELVLSVRDGSWNINVLYERHFGVVFGEGWNNFVSAFGLVAGDIICFSYARNGNIDVAAFDSTSSYEKFSHGKFDWMQNRFCVLMWVCAENAFEQPQSITLPCGVEEVCELKLRSSKGMFIVNAKKNIDGNWVLFGNEWKRLVGAHNINSNAYLIFQKENGLMYDLKVCREADPYFELNIQEHHKNWVTILAIFIDVYDVRSMKVVVLISLKGRFKVQVKHFRGGGRKQSKHVVFGTGWKDFYKRNYLSNGAKCRFQLMKASGNKSADTFMMNVVVKK